MSDWRQIQARIRKARTSADPPGQLTALYERTRDAMVAFELAQIYEKAGANADAARWYTSAAERFRRAQWKQKAEEALTRLGAPIPADHPTPPAEPTLKDFKEETTARMEPIISEITEESITESAEELDGGQQESVFEQPQSAAAPASQAGDAGDARRRKRRGRRGGRGRNKGARGVAGASPALAPSPAPLPVPPSIFDQAAEHRPAPAARAFSADAVSHARPQETEVLRSAEPPASSLHVRTRSGDPALSSRMVQLESQLRRMLACSPHSVEAPEEAPAGPGVFLITDSDLTTYYYVEACQTLRVGIGNLTRSGRSGRDEGDIKGKLADHLGINEARVGKYLKEHCVVRWLQLDEGAPLLSHFSVAVLRPIAND